LIEITITWLAITDRKLRDVAGALLDTIAFAGANTPSGPQTELAICVAWTRWQLESILVLARLKFLHVALSRGATKIVLLDHLTP
jgi:hypothetical protein